MILIERKYSILNLKLYFDIRSNKIIYFLLINIMHTLIEELLIKPHKAYIDSLLLGTEHKRILPSLEGCTSKSPRRDSSSSSSSLSYSTSTPIATTPIASSSPPRITTNTFLTEAEKDARTVFCRQLARSLTEEELIDFLQQPIRAVRFVVDKVTRRHRGMAYVEFAEEEMIDVVLREKNGRKLKGIPIIIERWIARKPQAPSTQINTTTTTTTTKNFKNT